MIIFGICLLIVAVAVPKLGFLWVFGGIAVVLGVILWILGSTGRSVGGRRHYY
jgi:hypothetical protein